MDSQIEALAETIWNYHLMKHQVAKADAILVLCSHDERVAERAAQLFLDGWAPLLIFSGGHGAITKTLWNEPEAMRFARIAERAIYNGLKSIRLAAIRSYRRFRTKCGERSKASSALDTTNI